MKDKFAKRILMDIVTAVDEVNDKLRHLGVQVEYPATVTAHEDYGEYCVSTTLCVSSWVMGEEIKRIQTRKTNKEKFENV